LPRSVGTTKGSLRRAGHPRASGWSWRVADWRKRLPRCRERAIAQGLNGRPLADYLRLAKDGRNNFRAMLSAVEAGDMLG